MTEQFVESSFSIGGKTFKTEEGPVSVHSLKFYEENPRIYSLIQASGLSQEEIEETMCAMDHVKQLAQSIEKVGLVDPIIVRKGDMAVLEGNSRLAAYRLLIRKKPHSFATIKSRIIVDPISDEEIDILLGQYHIVGRKDWEPYEQAAFMTRQLDRGLAKGDLAQSYGLTMQKVNHYIATYQFMQEHGLVDPDKWSYWDEYLKGSKIKKIRQDDECRDDLDELAIRLVQTGEISNSNQDIRKLNSICGTAENPRRAKILNEFLDEEISFSEAVEKVEAGADASSVIDTCAKFRTFITSSETRDHITEMSQQDRSKCDFELKKIVAALKNLGYLK